jgi:transaldolase/glucose-6-phosphate isomerase
VTLFSDSYKQHLKALDEKRKKLLDQRLDPVSMSLGSAQTAVDKRLADWQAADFGRRLWAKDFTLWAKEPAEISNRLGWLTLPETMSAPAADLAQFVEAARSDGFDNVVLLGMGGSSLAPEVFETTFGHRSGYPDLCVLDSTHPDAVRAVEKTADLAHTLFIVSSKSGTTTEPNSYMKYFWARVNEKTGNAARQFVAITDPGTPMVKEAQARKFRRIFETLPDVGGRYSALTNFGLVPAALIGVDVPRLLEVAGGMAQACGSAVPVASNPALRLGAALGELALAGRDKVTFATSRSFALLPAWLEQLIAESTGKNGKGIVPVAGEPLGPPEVYGRDRVFVYIRATQDADPDQPAKVKALEAAGHPVIRIEAGETLDLGQEFFRWELAVAAAGAVLGIQPFDQPDVELAKVLARQAMTGAAQTVAGAEPVRAADADALKSAARDWIAKAKPGNYISIQAYLAPKAATTTALESLQKTLRDTTRLATTLGYGPRFLHSTGQLHKGGPNTGLFVQFVDEPSEPLPVPETDYSFGQLIKAQALGDFQALVQRGRRVLRVNLGKSVTDGLRQFENAVRG